MSPRASGRAAEAGAGALDGRQLQPAKHQVAGHLRENGKAGSLVDVQRGTWYKPLQEGQRGERELAFYRRLFNREATTGQPRRQGCGQTEQGPQEGAGEGASVRAGDVVRGRSCSGVSGSAASGHPVLAHFVPEFFGCDLVSGRPYLRLEDVTRGYQKPSIADIKVGFRTWYAQADDAYIQKCQRKDRATTSAALGFKVCGMQVFDEESGSYFKASKNWCKDSLTPASVGEALKRFASNGRGLNAENVYGGPQGALAQLQELESWFRQQTEFHFYSSSVLLIYEGQAKSPEEARVQVKLIDFAHTHQEMGGQDNNFLSGLQSLREAMSAHVECSPEQDAEAPATPADS